MTAWVCTWEGCTAPAAARVAVPQFPYPPGCGIGFATVYPPDSRVAMGLPFCAEHAHHQVDLMLMTARPAPASGEAPDA